MMSRLLSVFLQLEKHSDASATASPILTKGELVELAMKNETRVGKLVAVLLC